MYINDLKQYLIEIKIIGLQKITDPIEEELFLYLKLGVLFYADDTVISVIRHRKPCMEFFRKIDNLIHLSIASWIYMIKL